MRITGTGLYGLSKHFGLCGRFPVHALVSGLPRPQPGSLQSESEWVSWVPVSDFKAKDIRSPSTWLNVGQILENAYHCIGVSHAKAILPPRQRSYPDRAYPYAHDILPCTLTAGLSRAAGNLIDTPPTWFRVGSRPWLDSLNRMPPLGKGRRFP